MMTLLGRFFPSFVRPSSRRDELTELLQESLDDKTSFCLLYTSPSPRDKRQSRMPSSA